MLQKDDLTLRPVTTGDFQMLLEWFNRPDYYGDFYNLWPDTEESIKHLTALSYDHGSYIIQTNKENAPVGTIGFWDPYREKEFHHALEIWYQVHPDFRKRGFAHKAIAVLVNHLFSSLPINRIQASVVEANIGSRRAVEKAGMKKEGLLRGIYFLRGEYVDYLLYAILRADWGDENTFLKKIFS